MSLGRGCSPSVSAGPLSAEAGAADSGGVVGFGSVDGGGAEGGGDGDSKSEDGGATAIIETLEDDSVDVDRLLPRFLRSACAEDAASSATSETMPMNFSDVTTGTPVLEAWQGNLSLAKKARHFQVGASPQASCPRKNPTIWSRAGTFPLLVFRRICPWRRVLTPWRAVL